MKTCAQATDLDALPDPGRRAFSKSLGLGLLPLFPLLPGCGASDKGLDASAPALAQGESPVALAPVLEPAPVAAPAPVIAAVVAPASESGVFAHPGLLVTDPDFTRIRELIKTGQQPWTHWWDMLRADRAASLNAWPNPQEAVYRTDNSKIAMYKDIQRAWCLALCWRLTDDIRYADKAVETMNAWANKLKIVGTVRPGSTAHDDHTFIIMAGIQGHQWAQVGEIMRDYSGWLPDSQARFKEMLLSVFVKISTDWLTGVTSGGGGLGSHANWHLASMCGVMAIGVFCDRPDLYRQGCDYYAANNGGQLKMFGAGAIVHGVYYMHPGHMGQWQESGRDQGHATLCMSLAGDFLEMAWRQGDDLYGLYNNRFLAGAEYVARSNLKDENGNTYPMPFAAQHDASQPHPSMWTHVNQSFQLNRNAWEPIYNHYVNRMGIAAPNVERMVAWCEPNQWSGLSDDMMFPTLTQRLPAYAKAMKPPSGLTAHLRDGRILLSWWGSVGATSYVVKRGSKATGPFSDLTTVPASELLTCTDTAANGIWFYQVTALSSGGVSSSSAVVRIAVPGEPRLLLPLNGMNDTGTIGTLWTPDGSSTAVEGKLINGATWGDGRLGNKAVLFDGKAAGLQLPPGIFRGLADFTISLWAYANALHYDSTLFFAGNDGFSYMFIAPQPSHGKGVRFGICGAGFNDTQMVDAPGYLPIRRWVHVAVTLLGSTGRLYLDGKEAGSSDGILLSPYQVGDQVCFLGRNWGHPAFNGRIQDFRVRSGALSAEEIAALAQ
jgi:hypothetical protein